MIEKIISFSARNRFVVLVLVAALVVGGIWCMKNIALDALPDLSDTQVIIYSRWDRSPDIIEDQVTYPIVTAMLGAPKVKDIRGFSDFGYSYVYIIFEDGVDIYWARSRVLEYLSKIIPKLPEGVKTELGPDATGIGWVFQYALVDKSGKNDLSTLRSFQDWSLRYHLQSVPGVAEVAGIGGFVRQYQVNVDPAAMASYNIPLRQVMQAVRDGNDDVGGRLVEMGGREYMIRGRGYIRSISDLENIVVETANNGTPILLKQLGQVELGPDMRRGLSDLDGEGDTVGGIVVMRHGENALKVIERVKAKLESLKSSLPEGVEIVTTYDRSDLILKSIGTLKQTLVEEILIVSFVILIFLWHIPSAVIPIVTIPVAVILSFIPMYLTGSTSNIMSLGGIAVAIGALVDAAVVVVENAHKKLERWEAEGKKGDFREVLIKAIQEVGRPSFFALLVIAVAFLPIFALEGQEGRLFKPLAFTKNFSIAIAAFLAITLDPAIRLLFTRLKEYHFKNKTLTKIANAVLVGKMHSEETHPISKRLFRWYGPMVNWVLKYPKRTIQIAVGVVLLTLPVFFMLGSEFMPTLNEGSILYMPTTLPGISVTEAQKLLQSQDKILRSFPEVERVFGKVGRAETATDPAPLSMAETTIILKPKDQWRKGQTWEKLIDEMNQQLKFPGVANAWTMPIKSRIDMLSTGIRTPIGIKIFGSDLKEIENVGLEIEMALKDVKGTRSVYAERVSGGYFIDFNLNREAMARYGISVADAEMIITSAIGGENIATTIEGRERYPINVRYLRELRDDPEKLKQVLVPTMSGAQVPLSQIADMEIKSGPAMIRDENGLLSGYVYVDISGRDLGSYVHDAKKAVSKSVKMPVGYSLVWSGQYEYMQRVKEKLKLVLPLTLFIIFGLLYWNTKSVFKTFVILLAVPFSAVGAIWLLFFLGYNMSIAVWVGLIALLGLDAETGIFMLLYLDLSYQEMKNEGRMKTLEDLKEAVVHGAVKRVRPKVMTVACAFTGLLPIMWATGAGSDVMKRIAAPMVGGLFSSFGMELLVYPAIFLLWKKREMKKEASLCD
ncbi:MAG: CusA/CzcA family heavy metal efflux RND transporter [Deltaproteobacteria bacterium]|nr:CusA/CzcA family heavy metal efflux RND transporter [Deltaproteobacteria bacterium]